MNEFIGNKIFFIPKFLNGSFYFNIFINCNIYKAQISDAVINNICNQNYIYNFIWNYIWNFCL